MPYLEEKQASKMPQELLWLLDLGTAAPGRALSRSHLKHLAQPMEMLWQRICPGVLSHPEEHLSLLLPPPESFGAGHVGEICFNPKARPSEERESELEFYSSPGSGDESQSWGNTAQRRNRSSSSPGRDFSPGSGEVAVAKLMDRQQNHQQDKKNPVSFHSHLWGDNREHFCFRGHKSAKLRTLGVLV